MPEILLSALPKTIRLVAGTPTRVWSYQGDVIVGDRGTLQPMSNVYLGPTIRVARGERVRIHFNNQLPEPSVIHWHGLHVPEDMDGHPRFAVAAGETYVYEFDVLNRAGTYFYHAHPHGRTGEQVYQGLAGLFIVTDEEEAALGLPATKYDVPLVIQDRTLDEDNQFVYLTEETMTDTMGFLGDRILVNGTVDYTLRVETHAYRLRLVNGSNFRIYKLAWSDGTPLTVIASDGGLLEAPVQRDYVMLAPGERIELWADFSSYALGTEIRLVSLAFSGIELMDMGEMDHSGMSMDGMSMETGLIAHGSEYTVMRINVTQESSERLILPERLSTMNRYRLDSAVNAGNPRRFTLSRQMPLWMINQRSFDMYEVADDEVVNLDMLEVWEFDNLLEGDDQMAHPMHIHGAQFQIIERQIAPQSAEGWETVRYGFVDEGWKDTLLIMPGERVKLLIKFEKFAGVFLYHCHTLEHEDMGMMRNYRIDS